MSTLSSKIHDIFYIFLRNLLVLTNGILFGVVALLFVFGDTREAIFLGVITVINITLGTIHNIRAWKALQELQLLTSPHITRIGKNGVEESVLTETIQKGDTIKLKIGDQVPCDSTLTEAFNFEINKGLITGESDSIACKTGEQILAGSIVTSGSGITTIDTAFYESRIARMTGGIKEYLSNASPIQQSVDIISTYSTYALIATLIFVVTRGLLLHEPNLSIVLQAGTMASMLVPQGIAFTVTLFFAFGAANLFKKNVLLQEINATEKLGRIKNLCMDKTGTLTENILSVKEIMMLDGQTKKNALRLSAAYIEATGDSSQTIEAIKKFIGTDFVTEHTKSNTPVLPFSSWRQYGAAEVKDNDSTTIIFAGPPQIFLPYIKNKEEEEKFESLLLSHTDMSERVLCFMKSKSGTQLDNLTETDLSVVGVFIFYNVLREGIRDSIEFFQKRGVHIRIISGDNPETTRAVAFAAGIHDSEKVITGEEMKDWSTEDFKKKTNLYAIFAGVLPEQKKQIVEAFKKDGFTAMIGDGANDALAIKTADLGIAMLDGVPAVRQLASVVLTTNSFTALPGGVKLADNIIRYTEMFTSMFLNQTITGLFFFITVSLFNYDYPFTPFNLTLINYFTIGIPGILISYWIIWPRGDVAPADTRPFLKRVVPFATVSALFQTAGLTLLFGLFVKYFSIAVPNTLIVIAFSFISFFFFLFALKVYQGVIDKAQIVQIICLGIFELLLLYIIFHISIIMLFFNIAMTNITITNVLWILAILLPFCIAQYVTAKHFMHRI